MGAGRAQAHRLVSPRAEADELGSGSTGEALAEPVSSTGRCPSAAAGPRRCTASSCSTTQTRLIKKWPRAPSVDAGRAEPQTASASPAGVLGQRGPGSALPQRTVDMGPAGSPPAGWPRPPASGDRVYTAAAAQWADSLPRPARPKYLVNRHRSGAALAMRALGLNPLALDMQEITGSSPAPPTTDRFVLQLTVNCASADYESQYSAP